MATGVGPVAYADVPAGGRRPQYPVCCGQGACKSSLRRRRIVAWSGSGRSVEANCSSGAGRPVRSPREHLAELADRSADARLTTIAAGHLIHETVPDEYLKTLIAFLTE